MQESILVVEPVRGRVRHRTLLGGRCQVTSATSAEEGFTAAMSVRPSAVLIALEQSQGSGLQLARSLRDKLGSDVVLIVFGRPSLKTRRALLGDDRGALRARWGFDHLLTRAPTTDDLDALLKAAFRQRDVRQAPAHDVRQHRPRRVFTARRDDAEIASNTSWGELIRAELDRHTLRLMWLKVSRQTA